MSGPVTGPRPAERRDVDACIELLDQLNANGEAADPRFRLRDHRRALLRAYVLDAWFGQFLPFPACWLAEREGVPVGLVSGKPLPTHPVLDHPPSARIENLWVHVDHRRQGIARDLVQTFQEAARRAGYPRIEVYTLARDHRALAFWRAVGFEDLMVSLTHAGDS